MGTNQREDNMEHKLIGTGRGREMVPPGRCTEVLGTPPLKGTGGGLGKPEKKKR